MRGIYTLKSVVRLPAVIGIGLMLAAPVASATGECRSVVVQPEAEQIAVSMRQMSRDGAELAFMQAMVRLDAGAIRMSELAAGRATHPELAAFAQRVVDQRGSERDRLISWILTIYGSGTYSASGLMAADSQAVGRLRCLTGSQFEVQYMLAMIGHDAGAAAVANEAVQQSIHGRIVSAASRVAGDRCTSIAQLENWLGCWYGCYIRFSGLSGCR